MSELPHDLRDYLFDELTPGQRAEVERFLAHSAEAREELERLKLTHQTLLSLPDEEVPRRIGFVSDKIFEPSPARRFWLRLWEAAPQLAFGSAALVLAVFGGLRLAQPTFAVSETGWQLSFASQAPPSSESLAVAALTIEQVRGIVEEVAGRYDQQQREALVLALAEHEKQETDLRNAALLSLQEDYIQSWRMLSSLMEPIYRSASADFAAWGPR